MANGMSGGMGGMGGMGGGGESPASSAGDKLEVPRHAYEHGTPEAGARTGQAALCLWYLGDWYA